MDCSGCSCHLALIVSARLHRAQRRAKLQLQPRVLYLELGSFNLLSGQTRLSTLCRKLNHKNNNAAAAAAASFQKYALYQREREGDKPKKIPHNSYVKNHNIFLSRHAAALQLIPHAPIHMYDWLTKIHLISFISRFLSCCVPLQLLHFPLSLSQHNCEVKCRATSAAIELPLLVIQRGVGGRRNKRPDCHQT